MIKFTPDGYTEALKPRPGILLVGIVLLGAGIGLGAIGWLCFAALFVVGGLLVMVNEGGQKRIRVTRRHLLMENEYRIWGLLIGPTRDRIRWEETKAVTVADGAVRLERTSGEVEQLGKGGEEKELVLLRDRILQRLENYEG